MEPKTIIDQIEELLNDKLNKFYESISKQIDKKLSEIPKDFIPSILRSNEQNELASSLSKAQGEFGFGKMNKLNSFSKSKYLDLKAIFEVAMPVLSKYGLSITQEEITNEDEQSYVITTLSHSSGQYRQSKARLIPTKAGHQEMGSAMTYLKRRTLSALLGIVGSEDDDDGEAAEKDYRESKEMGTSISIQEDLKDKGYQRINKTELDELYYTLEGHPDLTKRICETYGINTLADLPKEKYRYVIDKTRENIKKRENK